MYRRSKKIAQQIAANSERMGMDYHNTLNTKFSQLMQENMQDYVECKIWMLQAEKLFKDTIEERGLQNLLTNAEKIKQTYFITIRPNEQDTNFDEFFDLVNKFISRKCFRNFELVFEQKGTTPEEYGKGFHCHILANMSQRSKTEVLRDTQSTFKHVASANCIQVDIVKSNDDIQRINGYMREWKSDDDHKIVTKNADIAWRQQLGLLALYTEPYVGSSTRQLSSPVLAGSENIQIDRNPIVVEMD